MATSERSVGMIGYRPSALNQWIAHRPSPTSILLDKPILDMRPTGNGRGLGLFAYSPIQAFTQIMAEPPLILMQPDENLPELYNHFLTLPEDQKRDFLALSFPENEERDALIYSKIDDQGLNETYNPDSLVEMVKVGNLMKNNAFNVEFQDGQTYSHHAVFLRIARINHSCVPNAHARFYPPSIVGDTKGRMFVHALRNLEVGEEILISYFDSIMPKEERQERARNWGFNCLCPICSDEAPETEGEKLRTNIKKFNKRQFQVMQNTHANLGEIDSTIEYGKMLVERVLRQSSVYIYLPELYDALGLLRAKAALLQGNENNREGIIYFLTLAALWAAKVSGPKSPDTMVRLAKLTEFAATKRYTRKPLLIVDEENQYRIVWQEKE